MFKNFRNSLFQETSIYSLVFTRITFGALMFYESLRYIFSHPDWIYWQFIHPRFHFKYYGFSFVKVLPGDGMYVIFYALAVLGFFIMIGAFYRVSMVLFTIGFSYIFLIDKAKYLNHFYMVILFCILMCFMPAHRYFSVDAKLWPKIKTTVINFWPIFLLRTQMEIILLYAGFVKINYDWLHLMPLKAWLDEGSKIALLDYLFRQEYSAAIAAYGVIALHIFGAPLLLWKKSRFWIFIVYCCFHVLNAFTFKIGIFPWMSIALTCIFFDPDWPAKLLKLKEKAKEKIFDRTTAFQKNFITYLIIIWSISQILIPMRSVLYPGYIFWTHEGHDFSWRMKIQEVSGQTSFVIVDPKLREIWTIIYGEFDSMHCDPDMILQFAHHLRDIWKEKGHDVTVNAKSLCSLNHRNPQILIDPNVDLAKVERDLKHKTWVMPFDPRTR
jgi:hypothetical protein